MKVLVTGGAGFLGRYVVRRLLANPQIVRVAVLDLLDPLCGGNRDFPASLYLADITDPYALESIMTGFDAVIHLAAYGRNLTCEDHPARAWEINVTGTIHVLQVARKLKMKRVVCCSSNITLSDQDTVYKRTKKACEMYVRVYAGPGLGLSCMGLRPSNIYGLEQSKSEYQMCAFAGLDSKYAESKCFEISGDGTQSRDWVHAADVARAFELALFSDAAGMTVDVCTGRLTSMNDVAAMLKVPVKYIPARAGDAKELISDPEPARELLDFEAAFRLEDRIRDAFPSVP